jgi:hypothetical protein
MIFIYDDNAKKLPDYAESILNDILSSCKIYTVVVTSTTRTPLEQAQAMYDSLVINGEKSQRALYKNPGCEVITVAMHQMALGRDRVGVIHEMEKKIIEVGPGKVSRHCSNDPGLAVVDIAPSSIPKDLKKCFENVVKQTKWVSKFLTPPADRAYHIQIRRPK